MEEGGAKRIVVVLAIAAVAAIGVFWYWQHAKQRALRSGNVYVKNQAANQVPDQAPDQAQTTPAPPAPGAPAPTETPASAGNSTPPSGAPATKPSATVEKTVHAAQSAPPQQQPPMPRDMTQPRGAIAVPPADTIPRNPPSGLIFAGAGKYQLYRQGDLTWRLDTDTGRACIIFATDALWSRIRVWDQGCGAS